MPTSASVEPGRKGFAARSRLIPRRLACATGSSPAWDVSLCACWPTKISNGRILRALLRQIPDLDVVRVQDTPLSGMDDPTLLQFAAAENRIVLTHDVETLVGYAWERVRSGMAMPGVIVALTDRPIGQVIEDLEILLLASRPKRSRRGSSFCPSD